MQPKTMLVLVPCDHRLKRGDKCPGHLVEMRVEANGIIRAA